MWTLSLWTTSIAVLVIILSFALHQWLVFRRANLTEFSELADTFWAKVWAWLKERWDVSIAAIIAAMPTLWSAGLDTFVILVNLLADIFPGMAGLDLSKLIIPDWLRASIPIGSILLPALRTAFTRKKDVD